MVAAASDPMDSSSRKSSHMHPYAYSSSNQQNYLWKRIERAVLKEKSCPICLRHIGDYRTAAVITVCLHVYCIDCIRKWSNLKRNCPLCNAEFSSWFFGINLFFRTFRTEQLPALGEGKRVNSGDENVSRRNFLSEQRIIRRSREEQNVGNSRTRPLPRRRTFGQPRLVPPNVLTERVLKWRASIYEQHLQAVPCSMRSSLQQDVAGRNGIKERLLRRIEPWIRRELQAVLGDPDPDILVHVVTSLFISSLQERQMAPSGQCCEEDNYLEPLRPFLFEQTNMFWHELRCFAESPFNMETYDTVIEYMKRQN